LEERPEELPQNVALLLARPEHRLQLRLLALLQHVLGETIVVLQGALTRLHPQQALATGEAGALFPVHANRILEPALENWLVRIEVGLPTELVEATLNGAPEDAVEAGEYVAAGRHLRRRRQRTLAKVAEAAQVLAEAALAASGSAGGLPAPAKDLREDVQAGLGEAWLGRGI
jgi:hypothetical protein